MQHFECPKGSQVLHFKMVHGTCTPLDHSFLKKSFGKMENYPEVSDGRLRSPDLLWVRNCGYPREGERGGLAEVEPPSPCMA